jgi:ABC-type glycerol-3-phosphate transport system permease component
LIIERLGLMDTFLVHILPVLAMPVGLFLIKQFIDGIPNEVIEAAQVDGAPDFWIYWRIVLPMIKPAIATIAILTFQATLVNAETSTMYINNESLKTFAFDRRPDIHLSRQMSLQVKDVRCRLIDCATQPGYFQLLQSR